MSRVEEILISRSAIVMCTVALVVGCQSTASVSPNLAGDPNLLAFLDRQPVTQADVSSHLGAPSATFEESKVLTCRIAQSGNGFSVIRQPTWNGWKGVRYDLVLAFDDAGTLRQRAFIEIRRPSDEH
jgi:hypothetical protein